ncbi:response regulator transcription factor [Leekyejoonella antrihumi]|uniref:Response regulator transcription factor n=1 Tax=Leekyejoonella antrihumi TaxID=1660198 RepID=A0A563E3B4_9MICO|nr:response regulator transcription factor [Leekyejoonella antrihumi]TWP36384.1 response regulator transcription factor [Leekyejoonella antrihumi]
MSSPTEANPAPGPPRVLVVEDERALAEIVRRGLVHEGFEVEVVHDGEKAIWAARERDFDVVLLDIMLPSANGYTVLKRLRAVDVWTPVLMLTAKDGEYDQADAFELGADDYLIKPFSFVVLVARIHALIRRSRPEPKTLLKAGDLVMDPVAHQVSRGGERIDLTPREFTVLELFITRSGAVLSKQDILDHVWGESFDGDLNIVEVYVGYLRKKVDVPFGRRTIETVRGLGYRLSESDG